MGISIPNEASWDITGDPSDNSPLSMLLEANFNVTIIGDKKSGF
jgi:hypothetical protein